MRIHLFLFLAFLAPLCHAKTDEQLTILHTRLQFVEKLKHHDDFGPITNAHRLLFEAIGYPDNLIYAPFSRAQKLIQNTSPTCLLFMRKTVERSEKFLFSKPISLSMGPRLYQQLDSRILSPDMLDSDGNVLSIAEIFLTRPRANIIILPEHSYGDVLDSQIAKIKDSRKVGRHVGDQHKSTTTMFYHQRADFALMSSSEVLIYDREHEDTIKYRSYPIKNVTLPITVHIMCNKNVITERWLDKVNRSLPSIYQSDSFWAGYENAYTGDDLLQLRKAVDELKSN